MRDDQTSPPTTPMRVAHLIETLDMGGAESLVVRTVNALAERGHEAHLIVMTRPSILSDRIHPTVETHYLGYDRAPILNPFDFLPSVFRGLRRLGRIVSNGRIDVVQTHLPGANFWGLALTLRHSCRVLVTIHNNREFEYGDSDHALNRFLRKVAYRMMIARCAGAVAVSQEVRSSLLRELRLGGPQAMAVKVVTNGVPLPTPLSGAERDRIRHNLGVPDDAVFVLGAGRFTEQKNFADLLAAVARLEGLDRNYRVVVAGDGHLRKELEAAVAVLDIGDRLSLPGNLPDLTKVMAAADLFVLPSLWEGLPLVLLEAMATGLPVVAYDIAGVDEIVVDRVQGRISAVGDVNGLVTSLKEMIHDPDMRMLCGEAARSLVAERFDLENQVDELLALYREVLAGSVRST